MSQSAQARCQTLTQTILSLHQQFGERQCMFPKVPVNGRGALLHIVVCTNGKDHLLSELTLPQDLYQPYTVDRHPLTLGFACHGVLRDRWGNYDFYCYLEDDLVVHDPSFFAKLAWFNAHVGDDKLLLPHRFERGAGAYHKVYVDGELAPHVGDEWRKVAATPPLRGEVLNQVVNFDQPANPHSGCFFLNARQAERWIAQPRFGLCDTSFVGPLESAATLGVMRALKIYKPARQNADFLEVEHAGARYLRRIEEKSARQEGGDAPETVRS